MTMEDDCTFGKPLAKLGDLLSFGADGLTDEQQDKNPRPLAALNLLIEKPGSEIDGYELLEVLGEGGMGVVYLAEQQRPIKRKVALKVIKPGMDSKQVIARFEAERQALALLDHPNIARVFAAGTTEAGRPYFVMDYVQGVPITEHCDENKLTIDERLRLFLLICDAVQHAHQKGIIHRDIKASNILVATEHDRSIPVIIDFGVVKALSHTLTDSTLVTEQTQLIGTPEYMSPEQAEMTGQDIDTRTDVYSLGVLLYELLSGTLPFDSQSLREGGLDQMRRIIREREPATPSMRLMATDRETSTGLAQQRRTDLRTLGNHLRGELDWITLKAMDKDRTHRYQTAYALAEDIQRFLNQEPVLAGPPSTLYKVRKFVNRNKSLFAFSTAIVVILILAAIVSTRLAWTAFHARNEAETQAELNRRSLYVSNMNNAMQAWEIGDLDRMIQLLETHSRSGPEQTDLRGFAWYYLWRLWHDAVTATVLAHEETVNDLTFSPDGKKLAVGSGSGIHVWDVARREPLQTLEGHEGIVRCLSFTPDGKILASGNDDNTVILWDTVTGQALSTLREHDRPVRNLSFNGDGSVLFSGSRTATVIWNASTGEVRSRYDIDKEMPGRRCFISLSPDDKVFTTADRTLLKLHDADSGEELAELRGHRAFVSLAEFSPDGQRLATGGNDSAVRLWDMTTHQEILSYTVGGGISSLAYSSDGGMLAASSRSDRTVTIRNNDRGQITKLKGHLSGIRRVAFSPDGNILAASDGDNKVRLWETLTSAQDYETLHGHAGFVPSVAISPDGKLLASVSNDDNAVILWTTNPPEAIQDHTFNREEEKQAWCAIFSPDNKTLAIGVGGDIRLWDIADWEEIDSLKDTAGWQPDLAFSPDGKWLVGTRVIWDLERGEKVAFTKMSATWNALSLSPDGHTLATRDDDKYLVLWDTVSNSEISTIGASAAASTAFSPDGKTVATGNDDGTVALFSVVSPQVEPIILKGHLSKVLTVAFSPDGQTLASGSEDCTVKLWNLMLNEEVATLRGEFGAILCLTFSPDGKTLISSSADGMIRLWRAASEEEVLSATRG